LNNAKKIYIFAPNATNSTFSNKALPIYATMLKSKCAFPKFLSVLSVLVVSLFATCSLHAQGDLMVFPKRLIFEGSIKTSELNLANIGSDTARYNISFIQYKMNDDGSFKEITTPEDGQLFADKFLRYYPRSVVLAPNESQVIKIQLNRASNMAPGEYRSHFYFRAIPNVKPLGEEVKKDTTVAVRLIPIFGITIPTIIRVGESNSKVTLSDLSFSVKNDTIPALSMKFNRTGNMSVYGDVSVTHISTSGKKTEVGRANGIAVYTPNAVRQFIVSLLRKKDVDFRSGTLHVEYNAPSDAKPQKFAEADLQLK